MDYLNVKIHENVMFNEKPFQIIEILNTKEVLLEEPLTTKIITAKIKDLAPLKKSESSIKRPSKSQIETAEKRLNIIQPFVNIKRTRKQVEERAIVYNTSASSIYKWLGRYEPSGLLSSLIDEKRLCGKGKSRLTKEQESIIQTKIDKVYLKAIRSRKSIEETIIQIEMECSKRSVKCPSKTTIRDRINKISKREKTKKREGEKAARDKYDNIKGHFPGADFPLSVVQIDHSPVDIILVDEKYRKPFKRPYLTLAIDVYSRLVPGFYLSFDRPSYLSVGLCLSRCILPKDKFLSQLDIDANWPSWGPMKMIHLDNAKEFRSPKLKNICREYGIQVKHRPPYYPHYGGHIERLFKTFSERIHNLPGSTFSNPQEKGEYNSMKNASMTLSEFEQWLTIQITKVYHEKIHSITNTTPIKKYWDGLAGDNGIGIPPIFANERKVILDFLPSFKGSVQRYGVKKDHIEYFSDTLRPYIKSDKKYIFKRDPRDISKIYFYNPDVQDYFDIPYSNVSYPVISIWEHREIVRKLKERKQDVNQKTIFEAYREQDEIERMSIKKTQKANRRSVHTEVSINRESGKKKILDEESDEIDISNIKFEPYERMEFDPFD